MSPLDNFVLSSATFAGCAHDRLRGNNQDAVRVHRCPCCIIAAVTDGCGSSAHSEYGARFGANFLVGHIKLMLDGRDDHRLIEWPDLTLCYLEAVEREVTSIFGVPQEEFDKFVEDHFLHTTAVAVITPQWAAFARFGDTHLTVNGVTYQSRKYPGNAPPFIASRLLRDQRRAVARYVPEELEFQVVRILPTSELQHFLIGSDGVDQIDQHAGDRLPGRDRLVGGLDQFWTNPAYQQDTKLAMQLGLIGKPYPGSRDQPAVPGLLDDDTTLVVGVRQAPVT